MTMFASQWLANPDTGYTIDQSIRFNSGDSATMSRSFGTPTDQNKFTYAFWIKSTKAQGGVNLGINVTGGVTFASMIFNGGNMAFYDYTSGSAQIDVRTTFTSDVGKFRDYSAWYHAMFVYDSDQGTDSNRLKFYINGVQFPAADLVGPLGGSVVWPGSGANSKFNASGTTHLISDNVNGKLDGYMAEIYFIDGQALDPTSFGEFDADSNQFVPIAYSGSFGNNGFHIDGRDSSDLGDDESGNGNDFSTSGLTAADQVSDSPTDNYGVMNPLDNGRPSNITLSDGNLTAAFAGSGYNGGIRSSIFFDSEDSDGWYAECTLDSLAIASVFRAGVANASLNLSTTDEQNSAAGWAYSDQGAKLNNSYTTGYGSSVGVGDVVGIAVRNGKIYFAVNNTWQGSADPVTESNPAFSNLTGDVAFCQSTNTGGSYAHTATWNFGQTGFTYTPPTGYKSLRVQDLPDPTIADGSEYYHNQTYTGNGSSGLAITNTASAGDFKPDILWVAPRSNGDNHVFFDSVRGTTSRIYSNKADAQDTDSTALLTFESDGFDLDTTDVNYNGSGRTYVAWQWHTTGGTSGSNSDGSVTSTVSANTTAGISIATYAGTGSGSSTVGHGLGTTPSAIILKHRDRSQNWRVFHTSEGVGETGFLNSTAAFSADPDRISAVSSTTFTAAANMNESANYVAYCFTGVEGFSKFASYTGNGSSTNGPFVYTGFKPSWVMLKRTNSADSWVIVDAARDTYNAADLRLLADTTNADITSITLDFLSNGFKVRASDGGVNGSGSTYVYLGFAESPFKTATAR